MPGTGNSQSNADPPSASNDGKTVADVLGQVVWLMSQSAAHREVTVSAIERAIMPAILLNKVRIYVKDALPVAAVIWARTDGGLKQRLADPGIATGLPDWSSGDVLEIIDVVAPFGERDKVESFFRSEMSGGEAE